MNCLERLDKAVADAERLISEKMVDMSYRPSSYREINDKVNKQEASPSLIREAIIDQAPESKIRHDGKVGSVGNAVGSLGEMKLASSFQKQAATEWGTAVVNHAKVEYEKIIRNIENLELRKKTVEGNAFTEKAIGKMSRGTVEGGRQNSENFEERGEMVLFKNEALKRLCILDKLIEKSKRMGSEEKKRRNNLEGAFKSILSGGSSARSEISEVSNLSVLSEGSGRNNIIKKMIDGPAALEMVVNSKEFEKYLDRQIVSSISRVSGFKKHYDRVIEAEDIDRIIKMHGKMAMRSINELIEKEKDIKTTAEYKNLEICMGSKNKGRSDESRNDVKGRSDESRNDVTNSQTEVGVQLARYQNVLETIIEKISKGNLECDSRFIKLINRTISKLGAYEDPVVTKMTVQFVVCKRYVEDYIGIKRVVKEFTGCDL